MIRLARGTTAHEGFTLLAAPGRVNLLGPVIAGTFVEDALDTVAAGIDGALGLDVALVPRLALLAEVRGVLTSELQSVSARGGLMFRFR